MSVALSHILHAYLRHPIRIYVCITFVCVAMYLSSRTGGWILRRFVHELNLFANYHSMSFNRLGFVHVNWSYWCVKTLGIHLGEGCARGGHVLVKIQSKCSS